MADMIDLDIEEAIPASQIVARKSRIRKEELVDIEDGLPDNIIMEEEETDDNIEYVEVTYLDDEYDVDVSAVKSEPVYDEVEENHDENVVEFDEHDIATLKKEMFYCDSCDMQFTSIEDHVKEYHDGNPVVFDPDDSYMDTSPVKIKNEDQYETEYIYVDNNDMEDDENIGYYIVSDANHFNDGVEADLESVEIESIKKEILASNVTIEEIDVPEYNSENEGILLQNEVEDEDGYEKVTTVKSKTNKKSKTKLDSEDSKVCTECNTTFPSAKSLKLHMRMHGPIKVKHLEDAVSHELRACSSDKKESKETFFCEECNKNYDKQFEEIHQKVHVAGSSFTCAVCNKKFSSQINLKMHLEAHQDHSKLKGPTKADTHGVDFAYPCLYCGRKFSRPHEKVKHERIHTGEKPYKCEICGKCFRVSYCLTLHLRTHTGARPYVCPHCNKRFKAYSVYNHHLMTHSDKRPYKCPFCPKAFKTSVQLGGHKNSHTKPFSCPECNRPFASLYSVKAHMETHKRGSQNLKHRCTICGAIYARMFALRDHMKEQHPEEKLAIQQETTMEGNITCSECNEKFSSIYLLKSHMEQHDKRKFICDTCGASYNSRYALKDHMKKFHCLMASEDGIVCGSPTDIIADMELHDENSAAAQSIIADGEEITLSSIENFQTEEVVTELNYL